MFVSRSHCYSKAPGFLERGNHGKGLFNRKMGPLQRQLHHGEYNVLRHAPMLESDFLQVNKQGETVDVHNEFKTVTVAVACTILTLQTPNVLLVARAVPPSQGNLSALKNLPYQYPPLTKFELTRLIPLRFVKISVHNRKKKQLKFKLASGRTFYMQLCCQPDQEDLFKLWVRVINLLHPFSKQTPKIQKKSRDPGGHKEDPAQRPQSPNPINLADKVSVHTVYSVCKPPSPKQADAKRRKSPSISLRSQHKIKVPIDSPVTIQEKPLDPGSSPLSDGMRLEQPLERPPSQKDLSPKEKVEYKSSPPTNRKTKSRRRERSKSSERVCCPKPSEILSLIRSCSGGSQKKVSRKTRNRAKGKKH